MAHVIDTVEVAVTEADATAEYPAGSLDGIAGVCSCGERTEVKCCTTCASHTIESHAKHAHGARYTWKA